VRYAVVLAAAKNPILPEPKEIIWFTLSFVVLMVVMWKYAIPPVQKAMDQRTEKIRRNLDDADKVRSEAQQVLEEYQRQLANAKDESNRIIEEARQTADQLRRDLMERAEAEVNELRERSREEIRAAQERATSELQARVGALAIELAEKVVESSLDRDRNMQLIERYIEQVGSQRR
jgi:F-type H+-transporting ATPase subunit b